MKKLLVLLGICCTIAGWTQTGYEIKVTFKPFRNQYIYLGHYFGKQYPIIDSVKLDANSTAVFKGPQALPGGIYLIGYPEKAGFFEILIDKEQHFSVIADTATIAKGIEFKGSPDNTLFNSYQQYMRVQGKGINDGRQQLTNARSAADSARIGQQLTTLDSTIDLYRAELIRQNPDRMLTALLLAMQEPKMPAHLKNPVSKEDSLQAYYYFKNHFWDGVSFWDGRLAYTTFFEDKLDKYINTLLAPHPDSVIREIDYMMSFATINEQMSKTLLLKFVNRYLNQKYMWEDKVFVHLFEKYFAQKTYPWLTEAGRKLITERAYSLMSNIMGNPAADLSLPDTSGKTITLYNTKAAYTVVCFWDPTCGHCKEVLPKLDSIYRATWKAAGVKLFAIAKETEGTKNDWLKFIRSNNIGDWNHVYYSKQEEKKRTDASIPGYSQLYDVQTFPTLYLLDSEKRIVAKKLSWEQTAEVLQIKMKGQ